MGGPDDAHPAVPAGPVGHGGVSRGGPPAALRDPEGPPPRPHPVGPHPLPAPRDARARDWLESMYVQYSDGLPGAVVDRSTGRIFFRTGDGFEGQLEAFYQAVVDQDVERFAIGREYALGLHLFLESLPRLGAGRPRWLKGQVTGPFSFAMTVTDENKRALAYSR